MENSNDQEKYRNEIYSKSVRAGKRTYFFDVKSTRSGDHYLTITESKKKFDQDGNFQFEKHKIFLYKEDFAKFRDALTDVIGFIVKEKGEEIISNKEVFEQKAVSEESPKKDDFTDISFEDI